jgi:hypothetical protein
MQRLIGTARQVPPALKTWWGSIEEFESADGGLDLVVRADGGQLRVADVRTGQWGRQASSK